MRIDELDGAELEGGALERCDFRGQTAERVRFDEVRVVAGEFAETKVAHLVWTDVACERSDFSMAAWREPKLTRVTLKDCRLTGARLEGADLDQVTFVGCQLDYASFSGARLRRVRFERCKLHETDFGGAKLGGTVFDGCDIVGADFVGASLEGADIRTSTVRDVRLTAREVKGLVVTRDQAAALAALFGLVVRD